MEPIDFGHWLAKFRGLIADHGTYAEKQLFEYVELMSHRRLTQQERWELTDLAVAAGAKLQKFDGLVNHSDPRVFRFPVKRAVRLVSRKNDKHTVDMFTRSSAAEDDAAREARETSKKRIAEADRERRAKEFRNARR